MRADHCTLPWMADFGFIESEIQINERINSMGEFLKKLFLMLLIASVFAFGLVGCGGSSGPESTDTPSVDEPSGDQPADEHPSGEHPSGEHPTQ